VDPHAPFGPLLAYGWRQADLLDSVAETGWAALAADLEGLRVTVDNLGVPLVATWLPARFTLSTDRRDNAKCVPRWRVTWDPIERARTICESLGVRFVDVREALIAKRREIERAGGDAPLYIPMDYTHLDAYGHAAVADALASAFR